MSLAADAAVASIWRAAGLDPAALRRLQLSGSEPGLPSSFAVSTAAQASLGAAALAATEIGRARNGLEQKVSVDLVDAAVECTGRFTLDGVAPELWDKIAGLYRCAPADRTSGSACIPTSRTTATALLRLLGLPEGPEHRRREQVERRAPRLASRRARGRSRGRRGLVVARAAQLRGMGPASASDRRRARCR